MSGESAPRFAYTDCIFCGRLGNNDGTKSWTRISMRLPTQKIPYRTKASTKPNRMFLAFHSSRTNRGEPYLNEISANTVVLKLIISQKLNGQTIKVIYHSTKASKMDQ